MLVSITVVRKLNVYYNFLATGVYIKLQIHNFAPPPDLYFSPTEIYCYEGVRAGGETFSAFSIGKKIFIHLTNWGKNMHFPPFF